MPDIAAKMHRDKLPIIITDLDGTLVNLMDEVIISIWQTLGVSLTPEDCHTYAVHESFYPKLESHFKSAGPSINS